MDSAGKKLGSEYFVYNVEAIYGKLLSQFLGHSPLRKQVSLLASLRLGHFTGERGGETAIFAGYGHLACVASVSNRVIMRRLERKQKKG